MTLTAGASIRSITMRHIAFLAAAAALAFALAVQAQQAIVAPIAPPNVKLLGTVREVQGLVTMSFASQVATVAPNTPVFERTRFVASSSGRARLIFDNGCDVTLEPSHWVYVEDIEKCPEPVPLIGGAPGFADALPLLGAALLGGVVGTVSEPKITPTPP